MKSNKGGSIHSRQAKMSFPMKGTSCVGTDGESTSHGGNVGSSGVAKARSGGSTIDAHNAGVPSVGHLENAETMTRKPSAPRQGKR